MNASPRGILLDIEGTTSSISFVYDVMFPFIRRELDRYLETHDEQLSQTLDQIARDAGHASFAAWSQGNPDPRGLVRTEVLRLMDGDVKATGLKQLQGLIWEDGFRSGEAPGPSLRRRISRAASVARRRSRRANLFLRQHPGAEAVLRPHDRGQSAPATPRPLRHNHGSQTRRRQLRKDRPRLRLARR